MALELGLVVGASDWLPRALALAAQTADAQLFLMDEGVRAAADPALRAALDGGLEAMLCATDAAAHGVVPTPHGPRFGSQYDHALLVRDATRLVAYTGVRIDDYAPESPPSRRRVAVRLTRDADHPKTAQGLRSAVGYAALGLEVIIALEPAAQALLAQWAPSPAVEAATQARLALRAPSPAVLRALATLRGLGHQILPAGAVEHFDVAVSW